MTDVLMPQMGESIVEGTVTKWLKRTGEGVERDEPLLEISTDKVDSEVPAPSSGVLTEILVGEGQTVDINTVLARIQDTEKTASTLPIATSHYESSASVEKTTASSVKDKEVDPSFPRSSPLVRRLVEKHSIDLKLIVGTGKDGRISKKDIEQYLERHDQDTTSTSLDAVEPQPLAAFLPTPEARFGDHDVEPLSAMRKRIAEHMVATKRIAPHVSTIHQVDVTTVAKIRALSKEEFEKRHGVKLTYMPFFLCAAAVALKAYPLVNASLDGEEIIHHKNFNIGIAVALNPGLIVPVIPRVDEKKVDTLQKEVADLAFRARNKQLKPADVHQGTFSISNYGAYGSLLATPAINQPQSAILGLGAIHKKPVVIDDEIVIRSVCYVTLTFDHRLLDGAVADSFLNRLTGVIEGWTEDVL